VAVVREEAADADSSAAMAFHTAEDDQTPAAAREKMRITSTGKVGINTTGPTHLLTVDGTISGSGQTTLGANLLMSGDQYVGGTLNVSGASTFGGSFLPADDNTYDLGSVAKRWANLYTGDLHLKNERGDWTVVEEEEYLTLRNNKTGKRYKLAMEEID